MMGRSLIDMPLQGYMPVQIDDRYCQDRQDNGDYGGFRVNCIQKA